jgi:hypothetical protein
VIGMILLKKLGRALVENWFPTLLTVLVLAIGVGAVVVGVGVEVPKPVPEFALEARPIYRAQVSGAWFAIFYVMVMAIALAFSGRGFVRFGPGGVEAGRIFKRARARRKTESSIGELQAGFRNVQRSLEAVAAGLEVISERQDEAEEERAALGARIDELERRIAESSSENRSL